MIENYKKDSAGNIEFTLHGFEYRVFTANIDIFVQQDVMAIITDASDENGVFNPFSKNGVNAVRELLPFCSIKQGSNYNTLSDDFVKSHYKGEVNRSMKGMVVDLPNGEQTALSPVIHLALLSIAIQHIVMDEDWKPGGEDVPLDSETERVSAEPQKSDLKMPDSAASLKEMREKSRQKSLQTG